MILLRLGRVSPDGGGRCEAIKACKTDGLCRQFTSQHPCACICEDEAGMRTDEKIKYVGASEKDKKKELSYSGMIC